MAHDPAHGPQRPTTPPASSPSERERRIQEGSEPSLPGGGTYFLGRYRIVDEIGVGGMASVHLARADGPGGFQKWVAIKRIHRHLAEDESFIRMFLDEARIAARISHPNVAQVFDLGKHRDTYWIAMEYLHGEPLREVMRSVEEAGAPLMGPHVAARVVADAAEGLHAAHELRDKNGKLLNLVHRDVTPHNLFVTYEGSVKVVDFGIAKVTGRLSNTRAGTLKGKLAYMSPEQVRGAAVDRRTDIFALGVVLWELTTGRRLFRMESDLETLERVQACVVPPPSTLVENYPVELETIVMRALAKDLNRRFPTSREMSRALQQYLMRSGSFVGSDEIGAYVKHVLSDRFEKREAHLQWAAEVTQTISLDALEGSSHKLDEVSILTYASDVQEVPGKAASNPVRPAAGAPAATPPPVSQPRLVSGRAALMATMRIESTGSDLLEPLDDDEDEAAKTRVASPVSGGKDASQPKQTMLGMGPPKQNAVDDRSRLPSFDLPSSTGDNRSKGADLHDYGEDDEDAVTRVMASPMDEEPVTTGSISTVHAPAPRQQPQPQPVERVLVSPSVLGLEPPRSYQGHTLPPHSQPPHSQPPHSQPPHGYYPQPSHPYGAPQQQSDPYALSSQPPMAHQMPSHAPGYPAQQPTQLSGGGEKKDNRTILIALIAATTTLIALALTALVVLKLTESPQPQQQAAPVATAAQTIPTAAVPPPPPSLTADPVPPQPTAAATTAAPTATAAPPATTARPTATATPRSTATAAAPPATTKAEPGYLTVVCDPACTSVSAAGRNLGPSPVVRAALPPGNHGVGLRAPGGNKSISVTIVSGQTTARRVKMGP